MSISRDLSLYNGVSNRSRGWKSRKIDNLMEGHVPSNPGVMRWDGAARTSSSWDNLRRDPELWFRDGDCYVHLYGQGQSRRGPAFKVPFSSLLEADCYPLIERFIAKDDADSNTGTVSQNMTACLRRSCHSHRVDLYIPAPPKSDKFQSYHFHLATRNFFAWVFRRSMVGEHLGTALITLMRSMHKFRTRDVDNVADLNSYLDEEGYLDFKSQPSHALAVLHLAEVFQFRGLYIESFAHCCGMSDQLFLVAEYQLISGVTRKLLRRARVEMDLRLGQMGSLLATMLRDELSEAHLGLYPGARAHLERFRTLLQGVYAAKFGYYPSSTTDQRKMIFDVHIFQIMRKDFEALFEYLVDESYDPFKGIPILAQGGICILQSVQSFDQRLRFKSLVHRLPLLPAVSTPAHSRKMSWLGKHFDIKSPGHRAHAYVSLLKATNSSKVELLENDLVRAYRKFEEDSIYLPVKADKQENIGLVDARKVRWILIYAMNQVLRQVTQPPAEVKDHLDAPYNLCISTSNLPPWKEDRPEDRPLQSFLRRPITAPIARSLSTSTAGWSGTTDCHTPPTTPGIQPDVDLLALARHEDQTEAGGYPKIPGRRSSITGSTVKRSLTIFGRTQPEKPVSPRKRGSAYQEIMVLGYGNGTNDVEFMQPSIETIVPAADPMDSQTTAWSPSTSSASGSPNSDYNASEGGSSATTAESSVIETPTTPTWDSWGSRSRIVVRGRARDIGFLDGRPMTMYETITPPRPHTQHGGDSSNHSSPTVHVSPAKRSSSLRPANRRSYHKSMEPLPLNIRKAAAISEGRMGRESGFLTPSPTFPNVWDDIKALMEVRASRITKPETITTAWEMYNDLGGLTDMTS